MEFKPNNILYRNNHISTLLPYFLRKTTEVSFTRKRIETPDGDFFDVDQLINPENTKTAILLHGLEGSAQSQYMISMADHLWQNGFNVCAKNFRSCSGEMNRTASIYHSGETNDLRWLISQEFGDQDLYLVGFSLGGNVALKYLGEEGAFVDKRIKKAVGVSVPIDLTSSSNQLSSGFSLIYSYHFMATLKVKVKHLKRNFNLKVLRNVNENLLFTFPQFDEQVTAPLVGFKNARDYWDQSSSKPYLKNIKIPTRLINAKNDPFLGPSCFPEMNEIQNDQLEMHFPSYGGHVGFIQGTLNQPSYVENSVLNFFE